MSAIDMLLGSECWGSVTMPRASIHYSKPAIKPMFKKRNVREAIAVRV